MTRKIRVGLIGYGTAGRLFHAPFIGSNSSFDLSAVVTANEERAREARAEHPQVEIFDTPDAMWSKGIIDLVVVATPSNTHFELAKAGLEHDLHVVVDKPFVGSVHEGEALRMLALERQRLLTIYHNRRWDGDFLTLQRLLDSKVLGTVGRFESRFEWWKPDVTSSWKDTLPSSKLGGILWDLGPHLIDQALRLFGPVKNFYVEQDKRRNGSVAEDDVFLALTHDSGTRSHLWMSAVRPNPGPRFNVIGSEASFTVPKLDPQEEQLRSGMRPKEDGFGVSPSGHFGVLHDGKESIKTNLAKGSYATFYKALARAIHLNKPGPVSVDDALAVTEIITTALSETSM